MRDIPSNVVVRLPRYLNILNVLVREGYGIVSSITLGERLGVTPAQIRKDFSLFGGFGKQGSGYQVFRLMDALQKILHVDREWKIAVVGMGELGKAMVNYYELGNHGFEVIRAFDSNPAKIGSSIGKLKVQALTDLKEEVVAENIRIAILTVSTASAQASAEKMVESGITAILNFSYCELSLPGNIAVEDVNPIYPLQRLALISGD